MTLNMFRENLAADVHLSFNVERVAPASLLGNEEPDNVSLSAFKTNGTWAYL